MRPSAARNRRPSNDRLIHLELFTDFFNEIGPFRRSRRDKIMSEIGGWSQPVDATLALDLSAGVSIPKALRGRSLS